MSNDTIQSTLPDWVNNYLLEYGDSQDSLNYLSYFLNDASDSKLDYYGFSGLSRYIDDGYDYNVGSLFGSEAPFTYSMGDGNYYVPYETATRALYSYTTPNGTVSALTGAGTYLMNANTLPNSKVTRISGDFLDEVNTALGYYLGENPNLSDSDLGYIFTKDELDNIISGAKGSGEVFKSDPLTPYTDADPNRWSTYNGDGNNRLLNPSINLSGVTSKDQLASDASWFKKVPNEYQDKAFTSTNAYNLNINSPGYGEYYLPIADGSWKSGLAPTEEHNGWSQNINEHYSPNINPDGSISGKMMDFTYNNYDSIDSSFGAIAPILTTLSIMFPPLAPLAMAVNTMEGVATGNPLQAVGGAVGLSGAGSLGSLGSLGDATQLANQGLGFSQIVDTLGYTGLGSLGSNLAAGYGTLAGLGSGALDSLGVGDALSGLTNGSLSPDYINATLGNSATMGGIQGAANGDIGTGVLAGLASPVVGYGVGQVANELEIPKNTVTNGALSGLSGGITNNVVGGNADILNSVVGGVANNVIGSTLNSGWNLLKDNLPEFSLDDVGNNPSVYNGSIIDTGYDENFVGPQQDLEWQQSSDIFDLTNGEDPYGTTWNVGNFDGSWSSLENNNGVQTFPYTQPVVTENVQTFPYNPPEITESQIDPSNLDETMADDWLYGDHNQPIIDDIYAPIDEGDDLSFDTLDPINVTENYEPFDGPVYEDNADSDPTWDQEADIFDLTNGQMENPSTGDWNLGDILNSDPTWQQESDIFDLTNGQMENPSTGDWNLGDILNSDPTWDQEADIFDLTNGQMENPSTGDWNLGDTDMGFFDNDPTWQQEADIFDLTNGQMENPLTGQWDFTDYGDPTWDQEADIFDLTNGEMEDPSTGNWDLGGTSGSTGTGSILDAIKKMIQDTFGSSSTPTTSGGTGTSNSALMGRLLLALLSRQQAKGANGISEDALNYVASKGEGGSPRTTGAQFGVPKTAVGTLSQLTNVTPTVGGKFDLGMKRN